MEDSQTDVLPDGVRVGSEMLIQVSGSAGTKINELASREEKGDLLRVAITGGGCNGLSYRLRFERMPKQGDIYVKSSGAKLVVDSKSALYLKGTELDYSAELVGGGFKFSNPNARSSCSCGESFSV